MRARVAAALPILALPILAGAVPAAADEVLDQLRALQQQNMDRVYQERRDQQVLRLDQARPIPFYDQHVHDTDRALGRLEDFPPADRPAAETGVEGELHSLRRDADRAQDHGRGRGDAIQLTQPCPSTAAPDCGPLGFHPGGGAE